MAWVTAEKAEKWMDSWSMSKVEPKDFLKDRIQGIRERGIQDDFKFLVCVTERVELPLPGMEKILGGRNL